eukprot:TRINITY_DN3320_c0_g1_i1.p1 TRINITY_DN3320_c0_g1~~TRINITY_DN3320_c0_g1_i1.p1  ORF type:complete len:71 (-),score=2.69 TRINITY_DN3320_c0_g1_i1:236-448(-)
MQSGYLPSFSSLFLSVHSLSEFNVWLGNYLHGITKFWYITSIFLPGDIVIIIQNRPFLFSKNMFFEYYVS